MATGGGRQRRTRTLEANEATGKGSGSNGRPTLEAEEDRGPTMVARPDGSVEAETAALWPDGPQGEPEELGPGRNALFTPQQMRRLDEWTDEAPLINASPGDGERGGFPDYMVEAREMAMASQQLALPVPGGLAEGPRPDQWSALQRALPAPGGYAGGPRLPQWQDQRVGQQMLLQGHGGPGGGQGIALWPDPMQEMRYYMMQLVADNQQLRKVVGSCVSQVNDAGTWSGARW